MEAATRTRADTDLALRLGSLMIHLFAGRGNEVLRVIDASGLTFFQMKALLTLQGLEDTDGRTVTALAESLGISTASASRAADGLVRGGLATRVEDPEDRRVRRLALTAEGDELAGRILSARLAGLEEFTASLNATERRRLEAALDALMEREEIAEIHSRNRRKLSR